MTSRDNDIIEIAQTIWKAILAEDLTPMEDPSPPAEPGVTGVILFEGEWEGALTLQCPAELASALTANMFQLDAEPQRDDIRDALGELTNMLAGNVRALLPQPCRIALPIVAFGSDHRVEIPGTRPEAMVGFRCRDLPLTVTLLRQLESHEGGASS